MNRKTTAVKRQRTAGGPGGKLQRLWGGAGQAGFFDILQQTHRHVYKLLNVIGHAGCLRPETVAAFQFVLLHLIDMPASLLATSQNFVEECSRLFDELLGHLTFQAIGIDCELIVKFREQTAIVRSGEWSDVRIGWRHGLPCEVMVRTQQSGFQPVALEIDSLSLEFMPYTGDSQPYAGVLLNDASGVRTHMGVFICYQDFVQTCIQIDTRRMLLQLYELYRPLVTADLLGRCEIVGSTGNDEIRDYIASMCLSVKSGQGEEIPAGDVSLAYPPQPAYTLGRVGPSPNRPEQPPQEILPSPPSTPSTPPSPGMPETPPRRPRPVSPPTPGTPEESREDEVQPDVPSTV